MSLLELKEPPMAQSFNLNKDGFAELVEAKPKIDKDIEKLSESIAKQLRNSTPLYPITYFIRNTNREARPEFPEIQILSIDDPYLEILNLYNRSRIIEYRGDNACRFFLDITASYVAVQRAVSEMYANLNLHIPKIEDFKIKSTCPGIFFDVSRDSMKGKICRQMDRFADYLSAPPFLLQDLKEGKNFSDKKIARILHISEEKLSNFEFSTLHHKPAVVPSHTQELSP